MKIKLFMSFLSILAGAFGIINGLANIPQIIKIYKTKSAKDLSKITYITLFIGTIIWILYGIKLKNIPILILNGTACVLFVVILIGIYLYGKEKPKVLTKP